MAETKIKDKREYPMALPIGTMLKGGAYTYIIEEVLGQGGCGITYKVSTEIKAGQIPVTLHFAVKENFPDYCSRENDGVHIKYPETFSEGFRRELQDFLSEGRKLNEICVASNNIVKVNETWEENGTAYYAMAFIDGDNLQNYVREKKKLSEDEAIEILTPILDAVSIVHQHNMLHLDIKPENIMLEKKKGGSIPILIDFGISLHFDQNGKITKTSKGHSQGFSKCYAPLEQQNGPVDHFAPEMDVYALGATLYFMLVGEDPKNACDIRPRMIESALPQNISEYTRMAILHAMRSFAEERTQTVLAFKNKLKAKGESNINYRLSIKYSGDGRIFVNNTLLQNGQVYQVVNDPQRAISILPGAGYKVGRVRLNNDDVTRQMRGNILTFSRQIKDVELVVDFVKEDKTIIYGTNVVTIKSTGNGRVYYGSRSIKKGTLSFSLARGSSFSVSVSPDKGNSLKSFKVNNVGVEIVGSGNHFTIHNVTSDTLIEVVFSKKAKLKMFFALVLVSFFLVSLLLGRNYAYKVKGKENFESAMKYLENKDTISAIPYLNKASEYGNATAMTELGICYYKGRGVNPDTVLALHYFENAVQKDDAKGQEWLGYLYYFGYGVKKDTIKAFNLFKKSAEQGYKEGMFRLGECYELGHGIEKDSIEAFKWYKKSANSGSDNGMTRLGRCYFYGNGVKADTLEAVKWYQKAAALDNYGAQYALGWCYKEGSGVKKDSVEAFNWFLKSAKLGNSYGMVQVGWYYMLGEGVEKNEKEGFRWFLKGAMLDNEDAMYGTAFSYIFGKGVAQDSMQAIKWLEKSADKGFSSALRQLAFIYRNKGNSSKAFACFNKAASQNDETALNELGLCYIRGSGVKADTIKAARLFEKAANLGEKNAMYNLALSYENGWGTEKNTIKAKYWYNRVKGIESDSTSVLPPYNTGLSISKKRNPAPNKRNY